MSCYSYFEWTWVWTRSKLSKWLSKLFLWTFSLVFFWNETDHKTCEQKKSMKLNVFCPKLLWTHRDWLSCPRSWNAAAQREAAALLNPFLCCCFATLVRTDNSAGTSALCDRPHPLVCLPHPTHYISQTALTSAESFAIFTNPQAFLIAC